MLRLDDGESGQLLTPLTAQNLAYQGAPDESTVAPDYATAGGNPVHYIGNTDSLTVALAKMGYAFTSRYGDSIFGALTWQNGSGASFLTGSTCAFAIRPDFNIAGTFTTGSAPFDVVSTRKVSNLNADYLDGFNATKTLSGVSPNQYIDVDGQLIATQSGHGDARDGWLFTKNGAPTQNYMVANKKYVDDSVPAVPTNYVTTDTTQTISGAKVFAPGQAGVDGKRTEFRGVVEFADLTPANYLANYKQPSDLSRGDSIKVNLGWLEPDASGVLTYTQLFYLGLIPSNVTYLIEIQSVAYNNAGNDGHVVKMGWIGDNGSGGWDWVTTYSGSGAQGSVGPHSLDTSGTYIGCGNYICMRHSFNGAGAYTSIIATITRAK